VRELARVAVVGRKEPVTVYEPMFHEEYDAKKEILKTFVRGLYLFYEGQFQEALDIFTSIKDHDPAAASYVNKCLETMEAPLQKGWNGVWVMTTK
jgi:adenylate cyclase